MKTGDSREGAVGSNPTLSASLSEFNITFGTIRRSTQVGRRGAPAKGVGRVNRRESSNLSFSAKKKSNPIGLLFFLPEKDLNRAPEAREGVSRPLAVRDEGRRTSGRRRRIRAKSFLRSMMR